MKKPSFKIGVITSHSSVPVFTQAYSKGWQLALERFLPGLPFAIEQLTIDDEGRPEKAASAAESLIGQGAVFLLGTVFSQCALKVKEVAGKAGALFIAEPLSSELPGDTTYQLRPNTQFQTALLAAEAAKTGAKRWAILAPDMTHANRAAEEFREALGAYQPTTAFIDLPRVPMGNFQAADMAERLRNSKADGLFNALYGRQLADFCAAMNTASPQKLTVVGMLTGQPEYLSMLNEYGPEGWIVTGYPGAENADPLHRDFIKRYQQATGEAVYMGALVGYIMAQTALEIAEAAMAENGLAAQRQAALAAIEVIKIPTPLGEIVFDPLTHTSTMGAWIGRTARIGRKTVMKEAKYIQPAFSRAFRQMAVGQGG